MRRKKMLHLLLDEEDIDLLISLLYEECDHHVYHQDAIRNIDKEYFLARYNQCQDLIAILYKYKNNEEI